MNKLEGRITGLAKNVRDLLANKRYGLEYYQREYAWERSQVEELLVDLTQRFTEQHEPGHTRKSVSGYREYFLGPIITSDKDGTSYVIDGQQRLTTITLLLIALLERVEDPGQQASLRQLVYSEQYGERTLTLDVEEREGAFDALLAGKEFDVTDASLSVRNIIDRFGDINELLAIEEPVLPLFCEWLLGKVILVEIVAPESQMAYEIFETMNDRGLSLTPTDMLKGFLLSSIGDDQCIAEADTFWRERVRELAETDTDADAAFFKAWLRAHHAKSIRERAKGATAEDWDLIGTQFHKWVRDNRDKVALHGGDDFYAFVTGAFDRMSSHYLRLLEACQRRLPGLEHVRYNAATGYSLQLTVCLAPVRTSDDLEVANAKMELVARYLNIFVARRILTFRNYGYSPTYYTMFTLARDIRHADLDGLRGQLHMRLEEDTGAFEPQDDFGLHMRNAPQVRYILARLTDHLERQCKDDPMFDTLMNRRRSDPFEIEHIWANHYERHTDEFDHESDFARARNRLGGLLLVPKSFNASYGGLPYEEKLPHYRGQNRLAASLHADTYRNNPTLRSYMETSGLPFKSHERFDTKDLAERQELYLQMCKEIWSPGLLDQQTAAQ